MEADLGGIMFWSLEGDDYANECGNGKYSLLNSAVDAMSDTVDVLNRKKKIEEDEEKIKQEEKRLREKCGESGVDAILIISQLKSLWELFTGHPECAKRTQINFSRRAAVISQLRSLVEWGILKDSDAARQTQIQFLKNVEETIEGIPVAGHIKAAVHCQLGQLEKCKEVALSASRTVFVVAGGIAGGKKLSLFYL